MRQIILAGILVLGASLSVHAHELLGAWVDEDARAVVVHVGYFAGCQSHVWSLAQDPCDPRRQPAEHAIRLVDSGWQDTCKDQWVQERVVIPFREIQCQARPLTLSIHLNRRQQTFILSK